MERSTNNVRKIIVEDTCPRCGGIGNLERFRHVSSGECFECGGTGVSEVARYVTDSGAVVKPNVTQFPVIRDLPHGCIQRVWFFEIADGRWVEVEDLIGWHGVGTTETRIFADRTAARAAYAARLRDGWRRDEGHEQ
jgi:hypothetical protein